MRPNFSALVVDDDGFLRSVMAQQLTTLGAKPVATAEDGAAACRAIEKDGPFDVVVSDLVMPGMDGVELLRDLSRLQPDIAVVLISSMDAGVLHAIEELARERRLRVLGTLRKPVSSGDLARMLERISVVAPARAPAAAPLPLTADDLRLALQNDRVEIAVQPKVSIRDVLRLHGVEALARWTHEVHGPVSPAQFVALAEQAQLIDELTRAVMRRALRALASWSGYLDISCAVNLSVLSLHCLDLPDELVQVASRFGVQPRRLVLEVTESAFETDSAAVLDILARFRLKGFQLSLDDFGTGQSSLERLRRMPFNEVKIDRGFVKGLPDDQTSLHIVDSAVRMAHRLGAKVVAEGIETVDQLQALARIGCDLAQGFYLGRPLAPDRLVAWQRAREKLRT